MIFTRRATRSHASGFTLVELLIVIVVIAILAALAVVAYNGVQNRAVETTIRADLRTVTQLLTMDYTTEGAYPADLASLSSGDPSGIDGIFYSAASGGYCVSITRGTVSLYATHSQTSPQSGTCPTAGLAGTLATTLVSNDIAAYDWLGSSLGISGDTIVAGAGQENSSQGAAYVFTGSGSSWSQQAKLTASDGASFDYFGLAADISGDTIAVSSHSSTSGSVYIFTRSGSVWTQQAKLEPSDGVSGDRFGESLVLQGDTLVVGAIAVNSYEGAAYVFTRSGGTWTEQTKLTADDASADAAFGGSLALAGTTLAVSAPGDNSFVGAVYVFTGAGSSWSQQTKLTPSDGAADDTFGLSVALDSSSIVIGAPYHNSNQGAAYVYTGSGSSWSQQAKLVPAGASSDAEFGTAVGIVGDAAAIGAGGTNSYTGRGYIFSRSGSTWSEQSTLSPGGLVADDGFGDRIAMIDGTLVIVASGKNSSAGMLYIYN